MARKITLKEQDDCDEKWKKKILKMEKPLDLLEEMFMFRSEFGFGDPYFRDLETILLNKVKEVLEKNGRNVYV